MAFATDSQLLEYVNTIFDHGVESWQTELDRAEDDVIRKIKVEWYNKRYSPSNFEAAELVATQWTAATIYRAIAYYIMPGLSQWRPESDSFREQIEFYQARYAEEIDDQFAVGIQYDFNNDDTIDAGEVYNASQTRVWR
tara:strand:+ start:1351 stop:1767 length:417 start_codon:yes stop_codon:yes gene_type:complete